MWYTYHMRPLTISNASTVVQALQDEIRRSPDSRYDHRLHGVLLVAQGMSCREVARLLGDGPRTVQLWVHRFEAEGLAGLVEGERPGRPTRLSEEQMRELGQVLRGSPTEVGMDTHLWDGKTLAAYIERVCGVELSVRQCQRLFRKLGFRLRTPRPLIAHADPEAQEAFKKTPFAGQGRDD